VHYEKFLYLSKDGVYRLAENNYGKKRKGTDSGLVEARDARK